MTLGRPPLMLDDMVVGLADVLIASARAISTSAHTNALELRFVEEQ